MALPFVPPPRPGSAAAATATAPLLLLKHALRNSISGACQLASVLRCAERAGRLRRVEFSRMVEGSLHSGIPCAATCRVRLHDFKHVAVAHLVRSSGVLLFNSATDVVSGTVYEYDKPSMCTMNAPLRVGYRY